MDVLVGISVQRANVKVDFCGWVEKDNRVPGEKKRMVPTCFILPAKAVRV